MKQLRLRALDPRAPAELEWVAQGMQATVIEVEGKAIGRSLHSLDWLRERVRWHLAHPCAAVWLVLDGERILGHSIVRAEGQGADRHGLVVTTYVLPAARRRGIAQQLLDHDEAWMRGQGLTRVAHLDRRQQPPADRALRAPGISHQRAGGARDHANADGLPGARAAMRPSSAAVPFMSTLANLCILAACALPIVCVGIAKRTGFGRRRKDGGYDNHDPRGWLDKQSGLAARANAAQLNSFEALPLFIAGVLIAQQAGAAQARVDALAIGFVLVRIVYIAMYLADKQLARSAVWTLGVGLSVALFFV